MSTGEIDKVLMHCLMFLNSLLWGDVNKDDDEDTGDSFDTDVDRGHVNNSNVQMGGDGNNYIGDDNYRLSMIEDRQVSVDINGPGRDGGMAEGDLGNTSTVASSIGKSTVSGADCNCCVIIDGDSSETGSLETGRKFDIKYYLQTTQRSALFQFLQYFFYKKSSYFLVIRFLQLCQWYRQTKMPTVTLSFHTRY